MTYHHFNTGLALTVTTWAIMQVLFLPRLTRGMSWPRAARWFAACAVISTIMWAVAIVNFGIAIGLALARCYP